MWVTFARQRCSSQHRPHFLSGRLQTSLSIKVCVHGELRTDISSPIFLHTALNVCLIFSSHCAECRYFLQVCVHGESRTDIGGCVFREITQVASPFCQVAKEPLLSSRKRIALVKSNTDPSCNVEHGAKVALCSRVHSPWFAAPGHNPVRVQGLGLRVYG